MGLIGNTLHAFGRLRHGKGFGIHSPFAFTFVKDVLRLPDTYAYYAYNDLKYLREEYAPRYGSGKPLALKYLKLIFRIVNHFRPVNTLVVGGSEPLIAVAAASVGDNSRVIVLPGNVKTLNNSILEHSRVTDRISFLATPDQCVAEVKKSAGGKKPVVVFSGGVKPEQVDNIVEELADLEPVYIVVRLKRNRAIWERIEAANNSCGMSFSNPHVAIMVPDPTLPRQHFNLWI